MENGRKVIAMGEYVDTIWEIYLERARYLLKIDELLEEIGSNRAEMSTSKKKFTSEGGFF